MKKKSEIDNYNKTLEYEKNDHGSQKSYNSTDDNSLVEELENKLASKNDEIVELKKKFEDSQEIIHDVIQQKSFLENRVNEMELKELSLQFSKCDELKNNFRKLEHRMHVTKEQLDDARNQINFQKQAVNHAEDRVKFMERVIKDLENRGLIDYLRRKFPETFFEYKKE